MPNWNNNLITLTAKTDEAKKQLHTFIDKQIIVLDKRNWNESLLDIDNDSIIPKPDGIVKLMGMAEIIQGDNEFKTNPNYDKEAEQKQREQNRKDYGYEDWYDFCNNVWGSKWGFCHTAFFNDYGEVIDTKDDLHSNLESTGEIDIKTDCAWSPAQGLMKRFVNFIPKLSSVANGAKNRLQNTMVFIPTIKQTVGKKNINLKSMWTKPTICLTDWDCSLLTKTMDISRTIIQGLWTTMNA